MSSGAAVRKSIRASPTAQYDERVASTLEKVDPNRARAKAVLKDDNMEVESLTGEWDAYTNPLRRRRPRMTEEALKNLLQRHGKEILEEEEAEDAAKRNEDVPGQGQNSAGANARRPTESENELTLCPIPKWKLKKKLKEKLKKKGLASYLPVSLTNHHVYLAKYLISTPYLPETALAVLNYLIVNLASLLKYLRRTPVNLAKKNIFICTCLAKKNVKTIRTP